MTDLICCLSSGKGTWEHVKTVIEKENWENIFLITDEFGKNNFKTTKQIIFILVDNKDSISIYKDKIIDQLHGKINGIEVALNLVSGTGKEHMGILSALLKLGLAVRFMALTKDGIKEI